MNDKDYNALMDLLNRKLDESKNLTKKEAINALNKAGILTKQGKFTKPYEKLEQLVVRT